MGSCGHAQAEELLCEQGGDSAAEVEGDCRGDHRESWLPRGLCRVCCDLESS